MKTIDLKELESLTIDELKQIKYHAIGEIKYYQKLTRSIDDIIKKTFKNSNNDAK